MRRTSVPKRSAATAMAIAKPSALLTGRRFFIALFLLSAIAINYIDRVNLSVAAPGNCQAVRLESSTDGMAVLRLFVDLCILSDSVWMARGPVRRSPY